MKHSLIASPPPEQPWRSSRAAPTPSRSWPPDLGGSAHPADLADPAQVATLINHVEDEAGPIDVLVNNAGIDITKSFADYTHDEVSRVVQVNLTTPMELVPSGDSAHAAPRSRPHRQHLVAGRVRRLPGAHGVFRDEGRPEPLHRRPARGSQEASDRHHARRDGRSAHRHARQRRHLQADGRLLQAGLPPPSRDRHAARDDRQRHGRSGAEGSTPRAPPEAERSCSRCSPRRRAG